MARNDPQTPKPAAANEAKSPNAKSDGKKKEKPKHHNNDGFRETVESVIVAFILAFLFRSFEAEAFVIPTGSMAPTLYGRHKDIDCEKCGYHYSVGASDEVDEGFLLKDRLIADTICPNCRYRTPGEVVRKLPVFKGDRILVNKFPYEFGNPDRWDVVVFKYPEEPQTNFIKRLIGLPGERIHIRQGDVYREHDDGSAQILRKDDPNKQRSLQILVYDNDFPAPDLQKAGWPDRWAPMKPDGDAEYGWADDDGWRNVPESRTFQVAAEDASDQYRWLRYRHYAPEQGEWEQILNGEKIASPRPRIITDFCGYNAYFGGQPRRPHDFGSYWVGDLTVECEVNVEEAGAESQLVLELLEGFRTYRCRFDLETGNCDLFYFADGSRTEEEELLASASTNLKGTGKHTVTFANVDDRLCVWVDGKFINFGVDESGEPKNHYTPWFKRAYQDCTRTDLAPVGIAAKNCTATVGKLKLWRDIYYRAERVREGAELHPEPSSVDEYPGDLSDLQPLQHDPEAWYREFSRNPNPVTFSKLGEDEFFMMGDNSPRSKDSRLWSNTNRHAKNRHAVHRRLLVGKAFFVYWPHGVPFLNDGKGYPVLYHRDITGEKTDYPSFRFPFYPNVGRMHRIR